MPTIDANLNQATLDSLRLVRRKLYSIPESELSVMSLEDQMKYGDSLHHISLAIMKLATAKLKGVNDDFQASEEALKEAAANLEKDTMELTDVVKVIRAVSEGLNLVINIVKLLG